MFHEMARRRVQRIGWMGSYARWLTPFCRTEHTKHRGRGLVTLPVALPASIPKKIAAVKRCKAVSSKRSVALPALALFPGVTPAWQPSSPSGLLLHKGRNDRGRTCLGRVTGKRSIHSVERDDLLPVSA